MKLLLHIGTKHGESDQIADRAYRNVDILRAEGVWTAQFSGAAMNIPIVGLACNPDQPPAICQGLWPPKPDGHATYCKKFLDKITEDISAAQDAGCHTYLLCCPDLHLLADHRDAPARLAKVLKPLFSEIAVVCFLIPHIEAALDAANQDALRGIPATTARFANLHPQNKAMDYAGFLAGWSEAFGAEAMIVIAARQQSPLSWLRRHFGIVRIDQRPPAPPIALDYRAHALLAQLDLPIYQDGSKGAAAALSTLALDAVPFDRPLSLSRKQAETIQARFKGQLAELVADWPTLEIEHLQPDFSAYPEHGTLELLESINIVQVSAQVIQRMNADQLLQQAEADIALADAARRLDETRRVKRLLVRASQSLNSAEPALAASGKLAELRARSDRISDQINGKSGG